MLSLFMLGYTPISLYILCYTTAILVYVLKFVYLGIYYVILLYYGIKHVYLIHVLEQKMSAFWMDHILSTFLLSRKPTVSYTTTTSSATFSTR
jgi:hypothetical protein